MEVVTHMHARGRDSCCCMEVRACVCVWFASVCVCVRVWVPHVCMEHSSVRDQQIWIVCVCVRGVCLCVCLFLCVFP